MRDYLVKVFIVFFLLVSVVAFSQQVAPLNWSSALENGVQSVNPTSIYSKAPSKWFGNWFNKEIGDTEKEQIFRIEEARTFPSIDGTQLWVRVVPLSNQMNHPCSQGCWLLLGIVREPWEIEVSNFTNR